MEYLDLPELKEMALLDSQATVSLSAESRALVYAAHHLIKDRARWTGASSEGLTDEETDEIDAIVEKLILEVMSPMIGQIMLFVTETLPENILPMDSGIYDAEDYPELYAVLPDDWKFTSEEEELPPVGFFLPSMAYTFPIGAGASESGTLTVGQSHGSNSKQLEVANLPPHTHVTNVATLFGTFFALNGELVPFEVPIVANADIESSSVGGDEYFDVTNQSIAFNYGIVAR